MPREPNRQRVVIPRPEAMIRRPRRRRKKWHPHWEILWIALAVAACVWLVNSVEPGITWDEVMDWLNVRDRERYSQLCVLGILLVAVCLVWRILRGGGEEE